MKLSGFILSTAAASLGGAILTGTVEASCICSCVNGAVVPLCESSIDLPPICAPTLCPLPSLRPIRTLRLPPLGASADRNAAIERVTPDGLALLDDGVPYTEDAIVAALAGRHPKDDVRRTLRRLGVLEQLSERGGKYGLPSGAE